MSQEEEKDVVNLDSNLYTQVFLYLNFNPLMTLRFCPRTSIEESDVWVASQPQSSFKDYKHFQSNYVIISLQKYLDYLNYVGFFLLPPLQSFINSRNGFGLLVVYLSILSTDCVTMLFSVQHFYWSVKGVFIICVPFF